MREALVYRCADHDFWFDVEDDIYAEADNPKQVRVWCPDGFGDGPCLIERWIAKQAGTAE